MKAIFKVEWRDGTPVLPDTIEIDGISAMENVTGNGIITAQIEADEETIKRLKRFTSYVKLIEMVEESDETV